MLKSLQPIFQKLFHLLRYPRVPGSGEKLSENLLVGSDSPAVPHASPQDFGGEFTSGPPQTWEEQDFLPSPPKPPSPLSENPSFEAAKPVLTLSCLCLIASTLHWTTPGGEGWVSGHAVFQDGEWWRLVTALLVHSDIGHLLANMPLFLVFGFYLNGFFGFLIFPVTALVVGILANLLTIIVYPPSSRLVGASGMLYGMVAMWLVLYIRFEQNLPWRKKVLRAVGVGLVLLFPTTFHPTTSYAAHGFGFVIGLFAAFVVGPIAKKKIADLVAKIETSIETKTLRLEP